MRCPLLLALIALATAVAPAAANAADDARTLQARLQAGMRAAKSFVVTTTSTTGANVTTTFVAPDRYHSSVAYGGSRRDVVLIGAVAYVSTDGGPYERRDAPPAILAMESDLLDFPVDRIVADRNTGTRTWGRFLTTATGPQKDQRLTCTYDKGTYRIDVCENAAMSLSFSRYDDPANVIAVPPARR